MTTAPPLNLHNLLLLLGQRVIDQLDMAVCYLLHLVGPMTVLVLGDLVILLLFFEYFHAAASDIPARHARLLGVFVCDLGQLLPPFLAQFRNGYPDQLAIRHRIDAEASVPDGALYRRHQAAVP